MICNKYITKNLVVIRLKLRYSKNMDIERASDAMDALGTPVRIQIYRMLVRAGESGLTIGRIQHKLGIPRSTLSHHIHRLIESGLVSSERSGTSLVCRADYGTMHALVDYLTSECCSDVGVEEGDVA